MKKILIALLAASMLFAFTACDDDSSNGPSREEVVISYIDSIKKDAVVDDLIASAKGEESALDIAFAFDRITVEEGAAEIPFVVTVTEGTPYTTGFWTEDMSVLSGKAEVSVAGFFTGGSTSSKATFKATSYEITANGKVKDAKYGEHDLSVVVNGNFDATISLAERDGENMTFTLDALEFSLPDPSDSSSSVTIKLDGKDVNYQTVYDAVADHTGTSVTE